MSSTQIWMDRTSLVAHIGAVCAVRGDTRSVVVETLRYKPEGSGFETRWGH
jgi:hypothetical protein